MPAVSSSDTGNSSSSCCLDDLLSWLRSVGIWWDEQLVEIRAGCSGCSGPALGVFAVQDLSENQRLCVIPRSAILSPRTTQLAAVLEQERLGGGLALTIAVMYEASLGPQSKWAGYFASLPRREYLPLFWTEEELQLLPGTTLEGDTLADTVRQDTQEDYEQHVVPLLQKYPEAFPHPELCSLQHFRTAASWVASRSFYVDSWHGDAMVPLADIFNHKASVVLLGDAWGVAELADAPAHGHHHDDSSADPDDSSHGEDQSSHGQDDSSGAEGHSEDGAGEMESEEGREHAEEEEEGEDGSEDAQHGFAVGGMPIINAAAAAAAGASTAGEEDKTEARWVRDGINLRLEIGICSMGPPDTRELPPLPSTAHAAHADGQATAAAAAAAAAAETAGCAACVEGEGLAEGQPAKRRKVEAQQQEEQEEQGQQQQQQLGQGQAEPHECEAAAEGGGGCCHWPDKRLDIVAASSVAAGAEVHNTYGELSNAQLVGKYGFCLPYNPFDEVTLCDSWSGFISGSDETAAGFKAPPKLKQAIKWLHKHSNLLDTAAEDEEAPEPPQITPGGRLNLMTAAVIKLLGASSAQLKSWQGLEDVLQNRDSDVEEAPAAVPLDASTAAEGGNAAAAGEATAVTQHFDDVMVSQHSVDWWGRPGLELLAAAVERRLQRYPASLAEDRLALQQQQQQQQQGAGGVDAGGEHATAVLAALQLRVCEQEALQQVLDAVQKLLLTPEA